jgi:hypothetical protein
MNIISNIVRTAYGLYKPLMSVFSIALIILFYLMFSSLAYYTLFTILEYYHTTYRNYFIDFSLGILVLWLAFNIVFNHVMVIITDPGTS